LPQIIVERLTKSYFVAERATGLLGAAKRPDPLDAPAWFLTLSPLAGFAFLGASFLAWRICVAKYASTGS
jgi:ABC-2 type transport system permease protein